MREYGTVRIAFWGSSDIKDLTDFEKLLAIYLVAGPHTTAIGCFRCPLGYVATDLGKGIETVSKAFRRLSETNFATHDGEGWVFVHRFLHHNPPKNRNQWKNIASLYEQLGDHNPFLRNVSDSVNGLGTVPDEFRNCFEAVSEPFRRKEQEQEQEKEQKKEKEQSQSDFVLSVFDHYRTHHPKAHKKPKSTSKEWKCIKARLEEGYTVEDLKQAIDGCHKSPFHQGDNKDKRKYDSLELIVRDSGKVTQFIELAGDSPAGVLNRDEFGLEIPKLPPELDKERMYLTIEEQDRMEAILQPYWDEREKIINALNR